MSAGKDTGGPAFPVPGPTHQNDEWFYADSGMTLRDYFAIHVPTDSLAIPQTIETCAEFLGIPQDDYLGRKHYPMVEAKARYQFADAMLAERAK